MISWKPFECDLSPIESVVLILMPSLPRSAYHRIRDIAGIGTILNAIRSSDFPLV
jgi:hypothetical protein